ncbi:hypothetical protein A221_14890, partial [Pseudomonas syringae pv. actinidiae ICMP 18801]|uniref:hypothetical protein n=1 Tax=Pseudomonas syringae TaxID=317 RepID=UPI0003572954
PAANRKSLDEEVAYQIRNVPIPIAHHIYFDEIPTNPYVSEKGTPGSIRKAQIYLRVYLSFLDDCRQP